MRFLFHPLVVHFPIALWLTSFLFDVLYKWTRQTFFGIGARYMIGLGLLGAAVSISLGFVDYFPLVDEGVGQAFVDLHRVHSFLAYATTAVYLGIFLLRWRWRAMPMGIYMVSGLAGAALITLTGFYGAEVRGVM